MLIPVILNPIAGGADPDLESRIAELFRQAGATASIVVVHAGQDPAKIVRTAVEDGAPIVVAAGGDGTVNAVASGLRGSSAALGVLPTGGLNHFAKDMGIPIELQKAVGVILARRVVHIDVGTVNDRLFVNNASIGIYPSFVEAREQERRRGHGRWTASALATLRMLEAYRGMVVRIEANGEKVTWRTPFVFVANNEYEIEGLRLGGRARLDGGRLFAYLTPHIHTRELPALFIKALIGRARRAAAFEIIPSSDIRVDLLTDRRTRVAVDGELTTLTPPLQFRILRGALKVLAPAA